MKAIAFIDYENIWEGLHEKGLEISPEEFILLLRITPKKLIWI